MAIAENYRIIRRYQSIVHTIALRIRARPAQRGTKNLNCRSLYILLFFSINASPLAKLNEQLCYCCDRSMDEHGV